MKVVIAGASGSGKTTLAKALAKHFNWYFQENSAGLIISSGDKQRLKDHFMYDGNWGQRKVINASHVEPDFGRHFQRYIFNARMELLYAHADKNCVFDRSTLDPIVFYLNQVVHNDLQDASEHFIHTCIKGLKDIDLILRIPLQNPNKEIENNGSRVHNWYFQRKVDRLFDEAIELVVKENQEFPYLLDNKMLRIARCPTWDWDDRFQWAVSEIHHLTMGYFL